MKYILKLIYKVIFCPITAFREIKQTKPFSVSLVLCIICLFLWGNYCTISNFAVESVRPSIITPQEKIVRAISIKQFILGSFSNPVAITFSLFITICSLAIIFIITGLSYWIAKLYKRTGGYRELLTACFFIPSIFILCIPISTLPILGYILDNRIMLLSSSISVFIMYCWAIILFIIVLREVYSLRAKSE